MARLTERLRKEQGLMFCPTCDGGGKVPYVFDGEPRFRECYDCEGEGWMDRSQQNHYFGEGGVNDAEEDQAYLDRQEEERST